MANYLIKQGNKWSVKVAIPEDVQGIFGKRAFKKSLETSDKSVAIARSGPLISRFKDEIEEARGNPKQHLDAYLLSAQEFLREARKDPGFNEDSVQALQDEIIDKLVRVNGKKHPEELSEVEEAQVIRAYKITDGQITPFVQPLDDYAASRKVEPKTIAKERHAVTEFASVVPMIQEVDGKAVRRFTEKLSREVGLKNKTIRDRLSSLRIYWEWLVLRGYARDDAPNPFEGVKLPKENRKQIAVDTRQPFSVEDVRKLHEGVMATDSEMLKAAFMIAIFTGCRIEEIASLETANVTEQTIQIVRAKSPAGNRTLPVHDAIKPLIKELVKRGHEYLLPDLKADKYGGRSSSIGNHFGRIKTRLGYDSRYVFHSLRKTVATQLEQAGVSEGVAADILGHDKRTMSYGLYSGGSSMKQKREAILRLDYGLGLQTR